MNAEPKTLVRKILFIAVPVVLLGLAAYVYWDQMKEGSKPVPESTEKITEVKSPPATVVPTVPTPAKNVCEENREKLEELFAYLDGRDYVASYELKGGASEHFKGLLARLLKTPPFVQREETDSLERVLRNKAHFYRILGRKDALLLRDIVRKEGDILESAFAILYQAMLLQEKCGTDGPWLHAPLAEVYPYALFFLNTMGGSSYLMRRDSRVRILVRYYSILILDQANQRTLNRLGMGMQPSLDVLIGDLKGAANLSRKEEYLGILENIRSRY